LPVPKYAGNPLDPPLRSRFQSHLISLPDYQDFVKYLTLTNKRVDQDLIKNLCNFGYSFYANENSSLSLPDFPVENMDKLLRIMNKTYMADDHTAISSVYSQNHLDINILLNKLYPFSLILKDEETNQKFCRDLMEKFNLPPPKLAIQNQLDYEFFKIETNKENNEMKTLQFKSLASSDTSNNLLKIDLIRGTVRNNLETDDNSFIMNKYHSSQLVDLMLSHSAEHDFCLIGPQG
jgi:hypothetical protein